ncbi:type VI secretion system ATPase TssH [Aromatoleum toluclasticum]|uniref:type VI secretion system ATPase TssH n=1 Tax=Aromatoleum toluclasticum TaxID=92003 RepID=UPI001D196580|nr:type VI secretion system ATPase TssH [Aromatoleum toluclasticum]MCC4116945.1 type VI secretion system ATPase TssH [Aromatoleum toluclasticum]
MSTSLKTLICKLNTISRGAVERAANLCMARGHYEVDLEHVFLALCEQPASDFATVLARSGIGIPDVQRDLDREVGRFRSGNDRTPVFSPRLQLLLEQAWLIASLDARMPRIRSGHLLLGMLSEPGLSQLAQRASALFGRVRTDELKHNFDEVTADSAESREVGGPGVDPDFGTGNGSESPATLGQRANPALERYTTNLTRSAREGRLDPVIGRDTEIRQVIDILMRRRQNNPILTGEAGVGKTAVVEGLAQRIADGDVPGALQGVELHTLDMGLLQAGASVKGEFENRLRSVIDEVRSSPVPIVLFIDEAHTIIGAGGQAGQNDAANLLKPALARGELRTVAATTWAEFKKYFEKDAALARRFQVVKVEEPSEDVASAMLRGIVPLMERHFGVRVLDEAVTEAVRLSHRYVSGRQLPDKAISVLDTACARVALAHSAVPGRIDDAQKQLARLHAEAGALEREVQDGAVHTKRLNEIGQQIASVDAELQGLRARHEREKSLVAQIGALRGRHRGESEADAPERSLQSLSDELCSLQGEDPMVPLQVDGNVVAAIIAAWTGIPLGRMVKDEIATVLQLKPLLEERVIGQPHALEAIAQRVRTARANLEDPDKPKGVFLFVGPSGVGKTETACALADILYGGERKLVTLNMSEYQEAHSVSGLKGSPPGYVGYGEGGVLTEAVRRNPYCVVLLDEVEKAHPDVLELFFQVFDKGVLDDAEGREVDFRNTLIILTSNVGSSQIMNACLNRTRKDMPSAADLGDSLRPVLYQNFKPAFLGRMKVIPYYPISDEMLAEIIRLKLRRIGERVAANHQASFEWDDKIVGAVLQRCTETDSGARNVDHILNGSLLPDIAQTALVRMAEGAAINAIKVSADKRGAFRYTVS